MDSRSKLKGPGGKSYLGENLFTFILPKNNPFQNGVTYSKQNKTKHGILKTECDIDIDPFEFY
jgi:hypothetical protein